MIWAVRRGRQQRVRCPTAIRFSNDFANDRNFQRPGVQPHNAIDIAGGIGLHIVAATDGNILNTWRFWSGVQVKGAGNSARGGNFVLIRDPNGYVHYYCHMLNINWAIVGLGNPVRAGQLIGLLGRTGRAAGAWSCPHLHYQVYRPRPGRRIEGLDQEARNFTAENPHDALVLVRRIQAAAERAAERALAPLQTVFDAESEAFEEAFPE